MGERLIFHVDVNSAFLSWTSVKRLQEGKSDLRNIPAIIGGDPNKRSSIVTAGSIPAKKLGIRTGEPVSMAVRKCPDLVIVPSDFAWYRTCSQRFIAICKKYAPALEQFSIDECFLDMTGTAPIYPDPVQTANDLKDEIRDTLGFTVNVGIGNNKLLAKMASDFEKPDKVHTLYREEIPKKMWPLPVSDLLFVGKASAEVLEKHGVRTIGDLAAADERFLAGLVGKKAAHQFHLHANGIDDSPVETKRDPSKGFSIQATFDEDVTDLERAHGIIRELSDVVASRMRREGFRTKCIGVRIRSGNYSERVNRSHQKKLDAPTDITREITETATSLFDDLWDKKTGLRLIGLSLTDLTKEEAVQLDLFGTEKKREKMEKADRALDAVRAKYGTGAISQGIPGTDTRIGRRYRTGKKQEEDQNHPE